MHGTVATGNCGIRVRPGGSESARARRALACGGGLAWDVLESRLAPAVSTWSGAVSNLWSDSGNWDVPPAAGNDLVFPAGAANLANTDDLTAGDQLRLVDHRGKRLHDRRQRDRADRHGRFVASERQQHGRSADQRERDWTPARSPSIRAGPTLVLGGAISGSAGLTKAGAGVLDLTGASTYSGTTTVSGGVLDVDSAPAGKPGHAGSRHHARRLGDGRHDHIDLGHRQSRQPGAGALDRQRRPEPRQRLDLHGRTQRRHRRFGLQPVGGLGPGQPRRRHSRCHGRLHADGQRVVHDHRQHRHQPRERYVRGAAPRGPRSRISGQPYTISYTGGDGTTTSS